MGVPEGRRIVNVTGRNGMETRRLTDRQHRFVLEFAKLDNATAAARAAGYTGSDKYLQKRGCILAASPRIAAAIAERRREVAATARISAERVLQEYARIAFHDPRRLFDAEGRPRPITELSEDEASAIAGLEVASVGNDRIGVGQVTKVKLADRLAALDALAKHLGLVQPDGTRVTVNVGPDWRALVRRPSIEGDGGTVDQVEGDGAA